MRSIPRWLLVLTRVMLGASFVFSDHGSGSPGEFAGFINYASRNAFPWYAAFLKAVVAPRQDQFATLVIVAELYAGFAMILGVTTRLAAAVALFLLLNYFCAKGQMPWVPGIDPSDILLALIVLHTATGRTFGIDRFLHDRFPGIPLW